MISKSQASEIFMQVWEHVLDCKFDSIEQDGNMLTYRNLRYKPTSKVWDSLGDVVIDCTSLNEPELHSFGGV